MPVLLVRGRQSHAGRAFPNAMHTVLVKSSCCHAGSTCSPNRIRCSTPPSSAAAHPCRRRRTQCRAWAWACRLLAQASWLRVPPSWVSPRRCRHRHYPPLQGKGPAAHGLELSGMLLRRHSAVTSGRQACGGWTSRGAERTACCYWGLILQHCLRACPHRAPSCFLAAGFLAAGFLAAGLNCASSSSLQRVGGQAFLGIRDIPGRKCGCMHRLDILPALQAAVEAPATC